MCVWLFSHSLYLTPFASVQLPLSYPVDEEHCTARFDKAKRSLTITLPVIASVLPPLPSPSPSSTNQNGVLESRDQQDKEMTNQITSQGRTSSSSEVETSNGGPTPETTSEEEKEEHTGTGDDIPQVNGVIVDHRKSNYEESSPSPGWNQDESKHLREPAASSEESDWSVSNDQWQCPPFSYNQELERVSFVLHVTSVKRSSLTSFFDANQVRVYSHLMRCESWSVFSIYRFK